MHDMQAATTVLASTTGVKLKDWDRLLEAIEPLNQHAPDMYQHSLRVGWYACMVAQQTGANERLCLFGGCGHDVGKCGVCHAVLYAKPFGDAERESMKRHPFEGFKRLKDSHLFSSFIAGLHHEFQPDSYGVELETMAPFALNTQTKTMVLECARLVSVCDHFDALTTRGELTREQVTRVMHTKFGRGRVVEFLLEHQIRG